MTTHASRAVPVSVIARAVVSGLLLGSALGCQRWQVDDRALAFPQPERLRLEIWSHGQAMIVHGVRVAGDSVRAVPYWKPPDCDSCAVWIARSAIDSVRAQTADDPRSAVTVGVVSVLLGVLLWFFSGLAGMED